MTKDRDLGNIKHLKGWKETENKKIAGRTEPQTSESGSPEW